MVGMTRHAFGLGKRRVERRAADTAFYVGQFVAGDASFARCTSEQRVAAEAITLDRAMPLDQTSGAQHRKWG